MLEDNIPVFKEVKEITVDEKEYQKNCYEHYTSRYEDHL